MLESAESASWRPASDVVVVESGARIAGSEVVAGLGGSARANATPRRTHAAATRAAPLRKTDEGADVDPRASRFEGSRSRAPERPCKEGREQAGACPPRRRAARRTRPAPHLVCRGRRQVVLGHARCLTYSRAALVAGATLIGDSEQRSPEAVLDASTPRPVPLVLRGVRGGFARDQSHRVLELTPPNCPFPASIHPHGVLYEKSSEGAPYNDGTSGAGKKDDAVPPGGTYTYTWEVPQRAGPGPDDGGSVMWMYHSHVDEVSDTCAGLMGPIEIKARGMARPDGSPRDVRRELFALFSVMNENQSPFLQENLHRFAKPPFPKGLDDEDERVQRVEQPRGLALPLPRKRPHPRRDADPLRGHRLGKR